MDENSSLWEWKMVLKYKPKVNQSHNNQQNKPSEVAIPPITKVMGILATFLLKVLITKGAKTKGFMRKY